ncbi:hypothetical protein D3C80_1112000 [compost metagenome]
MKRQMRVRLEFRNREGGVEPRGGLGIFTRRDQVLRRHGRIRARLALRRSESGQASVDNLTPRQSF